MSKVVAVRSAFSMMALGLTLLAVPQLRAANITDPPQHAGASHGGPQGYLGIDVRDVADEEISMLHLHDGRGAEIIKVDHDGPAGKMGLRERDVVLQMNGTSIDGEEQIRRMLRECTPGRNITMLISRDGQQLTVTAQMADRAAVERQVWEQHLATPPGGLSGPQAPANALPTGDSFAANAAPSGPAPASRYSRSFIGNLLTSPTYTGAMLEVMSPQLAQFFGVPSGAGLLVRSIENNSPAAMAGIKAGDVVVKANSKRVGTMSEWAKSIREAKGAPVSVVFLRDKQERTVLLTPDTRKRSELELPSESAAPAYHLACLTEL